MSPDAGLCRNIGRGRARRQGRRRSDATETIAAAGRIASRDLLRPSRRLNLIAMVQLKAPWNERNGRFSPLKAVVFAGLFVPAAWIAYLAATGALEPKVVTEMIHRTGLWAIRFLTLSLLITPLMRGPKFIAVRRMIGVAAFAYAV